MTNTGLEKGIVRLVPHNPQWQQLYADEKARLQEVIGAHILELQHIGSTAIPGIVAKPIIDIGAAVESFEGAFVCVDPLVSINYEYHGENGIPRRHFFVFGAPRTIHLHMFEHSSEAWENHILFRDYLIGHPETAAEYSALKLSLAEQFTHDRERYTDEKGPFITQVIRLAREEKQKNMR